MEGKTFTAIDFETAQGYRWSICQVGLVRVVNGIITGKIDLLVQPPDNYYWKNFVDLHGISWNMTKNAPAFDEVWPVIEPYIRGQHVVAHNSAFDFSCIRQALAWYGIDEPEYTGHCTYRIYGKSLSRLCEQYGIGLNHHNALSDAMACAELFLQHLKNDE
ncbi:MAG: 3'-5' exonuclease [Cyclobacteriaceae bacterium]|nr:3'-5' exonuclease [Cyclobacteriaceae bacterium]